MTREIEGFEKRKDDEIDEMNEWKERQFEEIRQLRLETKNKQ